MSGLEYDSGDSSESVSGCEEGEPAAGNGQTNERLDEQALSGQDTRVTAGEREKEEEEDDEGERQPSSDTSGGEEEEEEEESEDEPDKSLDTTADSEAHPAKNLKASAFLDSSDESDVEDERRGGEGGDEVGLEVEEEAEEQAMAGEEEEKEGRKGGGGERKADEVLRRRMKFLDDSDIEGEGEEGDESRDLESSASTSQLEQSRNESTTQEDLFGASDDEEEEGAAGEGGGGRRKRTRDASFDGESDTELREGGANRLNEGSDDEEDSIRDRGEEEEAEGEEEEEESVPDVGGERVVGDERGEEEDEDPGPSNVGVSDWDSMMQKRKEAMAKARRRRKRDIDITAVDDHIMAMIRQMRHAVEEDRQLNQARQPALKKLKMLPTVLTNLKKADLQTSFIECGILTVLAEWLSPLPDRSLPHLKIREAILDVLKSYPIPESHILKSSRIGKTVMLLYRHPKETRKNKEKAGKIINEWARPIFGLASDFKSLGRDEREERDYANLSQAKKRRLSSSSDPNKKTSQEDEYEPSKPGDKGWIGRARVPMPSTRDYVVRPKWKAEQEFKRGPSKKIMNRYEKQINKEKQRKMRGKNMHAVSISVEGRKMAL